MAGFLAAASRWGRSGRLAALGLVCVSMAAVGCDGGGGGGAGNGGGGSGGNGSGGGAGGANGGGGGAGGADGGGGSAGGAGGAGGGGGQACVPSPEACDGIDNDCNGLVDEGNPGGGGGCCGGTLQCMSGALVCQSGLTIYLGETFANNGLGWTLDPDWQIGPAAAGCGDPASDATPTADDGVAGVVIGGCGPTVSAWQYLTSPPIDTSAAPAVFLTFKRWLVSDSTPYMDNRVEVYDGVDWIMVWSSGPSPAIIDSAWMTLSYDLSAFKNAQMRVRFGAAKPAIGNSLRGSWNIDDVYVSDAPCP
ncbi:MAG: hypothetical protein IT372_19290 [Polyangiaceae bacterium]|nr:hypothetical protein [Polyangiaceae bacterium]